MPQGTHRLGALLGAVAACAALAASASAATVQVDTEAELRSAIAAAASGDTIELTADVVVTSEVVVDNRVLTIDGNGYALSVPVPGLTSSGVAAASPSAFRVLSITETTGTTNVTLRDLVIRGGKIGTAVSDGVQGRGAGVRVDTGAVARIVDTTITQGLSRTTGDADYHSVGGGLNNRGTTILLRSRIIRNQAGYGGGIANSGLLIIKDSSVSENRGLGGGGADLLAGQTYIDNSTFANNTGTGVGAAFSAWAAARIIVTGSTFTGNVLYKPVCDGVFPTSPAGGAIAYRGRDGSLDFDGNAARTIRIASSAFAYNYRANTTCATVANPSYPTAFALDDFSGSNAGAPGSPMRASAVPTAIVAYSVYMAADVTPSTGASTITSSRRYTGAADGSDNAVVASGASLKVTDETGAEIGTATAFRPLIATDASRSYVPLKAGGFAFEPASRGTPIRFDYDDDGTPRIAYYDRAAGTPAWVTWINAPTSADLVGADQIGTSRDGSTPTAGAIEGGATALYSVSSPLTAGGTVSGASVYGDTYPAGTRVTVTALPEAGRTLSCWLVNGANACGGAPTANPYTFTVTANTVLVPVYGTAAAGSRSASFAGNNQTLGVPPDAISSSGTITIPGNTGGLCRIGYSFAGWNTLASGAGTDYEPGAAYTGGANLGLYAKWIADPEETCFDVLTVTVAGTGTGSVSADTGAIAGCAAGAGVCSGSYLRGTAVTLTPTPAAGNAFAGWSGACTGTGTCTVTLARSTSVAARFDPVAADAAQAARATGPSVRIARVLDRRTVLVVRVRASAAGRLRLIATRPANRTRAEGPVCRIAGRATRAGLVDLRCPLGAAVLAARRSGAVPLDLAVTLTAATGTATAARAVRLRALPTQAAGPVTG